MELIIAPCHIHTYYILGLIFFVDKVNTGGKDDTNFYFLITFNE